MQNADDFYAPAAHAIENGVGMDPCRAQVRMHLVAWSPYEGPITEPLGGRSMSNNSLSAISGEATRAK